MISYLLHQFHDMLIRCIHIFSFVHKVLVNDSTISVQPNNSWFIILPKKEKEKLSLSLYKCLYRLKDSSLQTRGHHRSPRHHRRSKTSEYFWKVSKIHHAKNMFHKSCLIQIFIHGWCSTKKERAFTWMWKHLTIFNHESRFQQKYKWWFTRK